MSPAPVDLIAAMTARYRHEREVGQGGMAAVYLAEDLKHHRSDLRYDALVRRPGLDPALQYPPGFTQR